MTDILRAVDLIRQENETLREGLEVARAEVERMRRHYAAASPEHNLLSLLDLYAERETSAQAARDAAREQVQALREALEAIRDDRNTDDDTVHYLRHVARAALAATKGESK